MLKALARTVWQKKKKRNKRHLDWKERGKTLFADDMILDEEILKNSHTKKTIRVNKQIQQDCKLQDLKLIDFL